MKLLCHCAMVLLGGGLVVATSARAQAQELYGQNLVVNGNAEAALAAPNPDVLATIPAWVRTGTFNVLAYGTPGGFPDRKSTRLNSSH